MIITYILQKSIIWKYTSKTNQDCNLLESDMLFVFFADAMWLLALNSLNKLQVIIFEE